MSGFQFMHVEGYGRSGSKLKGAKRAKEGTGRVKGSGGWSAREILAEVLREPQASHHVPCPLPPEVLYGDVEMLANELDKLGPPPAGTRKDTPIMLAGIASAPWPPGDPRSPQWRDDVIKHVKKKFGANLRAVVGHNDEKQDHIHFYVTLPGYEPIKNLHPGMKAREAAKAKGGKGFELEAEYKGAMRSWQDEYSAEVGITHGQTRIGPGVQRLNRAEWKARQADADHAALALKTIGEAQERARLTAEEITLKALLLEADAEIAASEVKQEAYAIKIEAKYFADDERSKLKKLKDDLEAEKARRAVHLADLAKLHAFNKKKSDQLDRREAALEKKSLVIDRKAAFLDNLLSDFYATMSKLYQRMTFVDRGAIEHLVCAVDKIKDLFTKDKAKDTAKPL